MKIASQICKLLNEAGIPDHKQRTYVAKQLGLSYPSARRLLTGCARWTEPEITIVLNSIGLDWDGLSVMPLDDNPENSPISSGD